MKRPIMMRLEPWNPLEGLFCMYVCMYVCVCMCILLLIFGHCQLYGPQGNLIAQADGCWLLLPIVGLLQRSWVTSNCRQLLPTILILSRSTLDLVVSTLADRLGSKSNY